MRAEEEARWEYEDARWREARAEMYGTVHTECILHNLMRFSSARHRGGPRIRLEFRWFIRGSWNRSRWESLEERETSSVAPSERRDRKAEKLRRSLRAFGEVDQLFPVPFVGGRPITDFEGSAVHELRRRFLGTWPHVHMWGHYYRECGNSP